MFYKNKLIIDINKIKKIHVLKSLRNIKDFKLININKNI